MLLVHSPDTLKGRGGGGYWQQKNNDVHITFVAFIPAAVYSKTVGIMDHHVQPSYTRIYTRAVL